MAPLRPAAPSAALLALALAPPLGAREVIVVDASFGIGAEFFTMQTAVNAASDGDVLLVRGQPADDPYVSFTVDDKALTIVGDPVQDFLGETLEPAVRGTVRIENLSVGKRVVLRGFDVTAEALPFVTKPALDLQNCAGNVVIEDCTFDGPLVEIQDIALVRDCASVDLLHCTVQGVNAEVGIAGSRALRALRSTLRLFDTHCYGGNGREGLVQGIAVIPPQAGTPGISLTGGALYASGSECIGGTGGTGTVDLFGGCWPSQPGGAGVHLQADGSDMPVLEHLDCLFVGSAGGGEVALGCPAAADAPDVQVDAGSVTAFPGSARGSLIPSPMREGQAVALSFLGIPNDFAVLFFGLDAAPVLLEPWGAPFYPVAPLIEVLGVAPASGQIDLPIVAGNIATESLSFWLQALHLDPTGTTVTAGTPSTTTIIDGSL